MEMGTIWRKIHKRAPICKISHYLIKSATILLGCCCCLLALDQQLRKLRNEHRTETGNNHAKVKVEDQQQNRASQVLRVKNRK